MYYQLNGTLKALALDHFDEMKRWKDDSHEQVKFIGGTNAYTSGHPLCGYSICAVEFPSDNVPSGWKPDKLSAGYVPDKRTKLGKAAQQWLKSFVKRPEPIKLYEALSIPLPIETKRGTYCIPGCNFSRFNDYAVLQWSEDFPELNHPEAIEITTRQYKELTQSDA